MPSSSTLFRGDCRLYGYDSGEGEERTYFQRRQECNLMNGKEKYLEKNVNLLREEFNSFYIRNEKLQFAFFGSAKQKRSQSQERRDR